jgi:uncharacterized protein YbjT (DUF2867 family)
MDLVIGGTGLVGSAIVKRLRQMGRKVRVGIRGGAAHAKASELSAAGVEVVEADLTKPETLGPACRGVTTVMTTATSMPTNANNGLKRVDLDGTLSLIDAAEQSDAERFIYVSYSGGLTLDSPLHLAKRTCEERLSGSHLKAVILRPSFFMEVWLGPHVGFDPEKATAHFAGDGNAPIRYVSAFDVAELAAKATADPSPAGTWEMGGPEALAPRDVVRIFERELGKTFTVTTTPEAALDAEYEAAVDPLHKSFASLKLGYARGDAVPGGPASAAKFGVTLKSIADYAATFRG